jgi:hypothetical protein
MPRFLLSKPLLGIALGFAALGTVGCANKSTDSADDHLPAKKQEALMAADRMRNEGEDLKEQGVKLRADGKQEEGDKKIKEGEEKLMAAEKMKEKAMMLKE